MRSNIPAMRYRRACVLLAVTVMASSGLAGQAPPPERGTGAWFGVRLPPKVGEAAAVRVGSRPPRPVVRPAGEPEAPDLHVARIVGFAREARARAEQGSDQMWGRVAGFPSATKTVAWAADAFRAAGIEDVRVQPIAQDPRASFWMPLSWEVRLLADPAFGSGTADVVLDSALPLTPSSIPGGTLTAPLVYVGTASPAATRHIDVKGKIAVQLVVPQGHMLFERGVVDSRAEDLVKRGAVGVFNLVRLPGSERSRDFSNCGNPCFNIGGRDGHFLEQVLDRAADAGLGDRVRARITLQSTTRTGLTAENAVAVIAGRRPAETMVLNAHVDGWFDGAGDNADGLAVLVALARHFARPGNRPERTLVLVASAGHHTPGINGPRAFVAANVDLAKSAVMLVNIEHVAQRNFSPARTTTPDGYREAVADSGEAPIAVGVTNGSPFLQSLIDEGPARYGVNFISERSTFQSGETGGWSSLGVAKVSVMQAPPLYHTTGEVFEVISEPGLERIARFLAHFVSQADQAPATSINP
jgi:Peptidase family M28